MSLAIQEDMLPGRTVLQRLEHAQQLGFQGVEFWADGLTERVPEIYDALQATGLNASGVNLGQGDGYLAPDLPTREAAIGRMRQAMADAVDLNAEHVIFVPCLGTSGMPDLTPYRSPLKLEQEMMIWLLRTVSDLAYAIGVTLHMQPVNRYETRFMTRLDQAAYFLEKIKNNPHVKIAANLFHMALEEADIDEALNDHLEHIGYIYLADSNRRLPGQGLINFAGVGGTLVNYSGWLTLECGQPSTNKYNAPKFFERVT